MPTIKCISLWQPWASLMAVGAKRIETRHWQTPYRGPIVIHAAKTLKGFDDLDYEEEELFARLLGLENFHHIETDIPFGALIATANLRGIKTTEELGAHPALTQQERLLGNYAANRFGWGFNEVRPLPQPVPFRGQQGLFQIDASLVGL